MIILKWTISLIILASLLGCDSTPKTTDTLVKDADRLNTKSGAYLLIGVDTTQNLKSIEIEGPKNFTISHQDLEQGSNFILFPAIAGSYTIKRIYIGNNSYYEFRNEDMWSFDLKSQSISYVGHLEMVLGLIGSNSTRIELVNRSTEAVDFLRDSFPNILNNRKLVYGGPGEDAFFDYLFKRDTNQAKQHTINSKVDE